MHGSNVQTYPSTFTLLCEHMISTIKMKERKNQTRVLYVCILFSFSSLVICFSLVTYFDLIGLCEVCSFKLNYHHKRKEVTKKTSRNVKREKKSKSKKRKKKHHRDKKKERGGKTKRQESSSSSSESSDKEEQTGEHRNVSQIYEDQIHR